MASAINLSLDKGTTFESTFIVKNADDSAFNLTGYTATARIRKHPAASDYKSFQTTVTSAKGEIKISMASTVTSDLSSGRNYYDVVITNNVGTSISKVFEGMILVSDTVSV